MADGLVLVLHVHGCFRGSGENPITMADKFALQRKLDAAERAKRVLEERVIAKNCLLYTSPSPRDA